MLKEMLNAIREHIGCLYQLSNDISELDVIVSLAVISSNSNYTRPIFGWKTELKNSMHPLMEISGTCVPVGNDVVRYDVDRIIILLLYRIIIISNSLSFSL